MTLVDAGDWRGAIAASVLMAAPLGAPVLVSEADGVPEPTAQALDALDPQGDKRTKGAQAFAIGAAAAPSGLDVKQVGGGGTAGAAAIAELRDELLGGAPEHIVIAPAAEPAFAMPAAAWAARSGDPVLFAGADKLPAATAEALARHAKTPVYVLGPSSAISSDVVREIAKIDGDVRRVSGEDPVSNAIAFARYADGGFGWNINDPGHGFVVASSDEPLDAAAAAAALRFGNLGAAAAHRQRRYPSGCAARVPARRQAGLHDRPDARLLQPRLGNRRPGSHQRERAGRNRRAGRAGQDRRRTVSEAESPDLLGGAHEVSAEDIRALAGASTPHFALQVRNRIRRLIEPLPADHPARAEGERKIAELEDLAEHSGDPRGTMGIGRH